LSCSQHKKLAEKISASVEREESGIGP
jgi:hypothetical protein